MHNNFYFLRQLTLSLQKRLTGAVISDCFSQNKDELIIRFETTDGSFFLRANLSPSLTAISFPNEFHRARKNSIDLFPAMLGHHIQAINQGENERAFWMQLTEDKLLLFKMHGNRSNIILYHDNQPVDVFRRNLDDEIAFNETSLHRNIDWSFDAFQKNRQHLSSLYFTFGKPVWKYLATIGFDKLSEQGQWNKILGIKHTLEAPSYYVSRVDNKWSLMLLPYGDIKKTFDDPVRAINEFVFTFTQTQTVEQEKGSLIQRLRTKINTNKSYIEKNTEKLNEILNDNTYKVWADVLMANLHTIKPNTDKIVLTNFYNDNQPVEIRLKPDLSPQKNAETFYRKAKNQQIEINKIKEAITAKEKEIAKLERELEQLSATEDLKTIRQTRSTLQPDLQEKQSANLPYHEFEFKGFRIWVGKNAESNDILTLKYGFKEDLWLHAKDVSGSHVLIKHQAGKPFPKDVIERAAELAAYNSKRKTDTLCPVIITPKKFVRKRKGDPAGAVVVEREEVILVEPKKP